MKKVAEKKRLTWWSQWTQQIKKIKKVVDIS